MECDEYELKETKFGIIIAEVFDESIVIRFKAKCGVIIDLFSIQIENNRLEEYLYGNVFDDHYTERAIITRNQIVSSMYDCGF